MYKRSLQAAKKGRVLIFHWRGGYLTKEVLKELLELIRKAGDEKDKTAMVSINWPQAVIRVQYTDMQVQESVTIEEANEGGKIDVIPDGSLVMGSPARIKRNLTWEEKLGVMEKSKEYVTVSLEMKEQGVL